MDKYTKKIPKNSYYYLTAIFLGTIGGFLQDLIYSAGGIFVDIMSLFYSGYIDSLYENVGTMMEIITMIPAFFLLSFFFILPILSWMWISSVNNKYFPDEQESRDSNDSKIADLIYSNQSKFKKIFYGFTMLFSIFASVFYINLTIRNITSYTASIYLERTIEIIRPYINESEFIKLRSELRLVDNKTKFNNILWKINAFASVGGVELPDTEFYGVDDITPVKP